MMICTETILTNKKSLPEQKLITKPQKRSVARWKKVNGNLICQWVFE